MLLPELKSDNPRKKTFVAIFASGAGSNAKKIIQYFLGHPTIEIKLIVCNKPKAGVIEIAEDAKIEVLMIERNAFFAEDIYVREFKKRGIDYIVLAGFLWKIPDSLIEAYKNRILNIHPALLPKYGGKGMYGAKVHEAVLAAGDKESGITIHVVDEHYDNGDIIFQAKCSIVNEDTADTLAEKVHGLEHENFAKVIENYIESSSSRS